ncbi:MAG TPA: Ig-like domain-containing protein [Candidatus Limnocylindria bacterium]|nr:Ig-like domain-containing protein [Candidatus Limnocylindria bacterium]
MSVNAATVRAWLWQLRPAITTVVLLASVIGLAQVGGRAPLGTVAEPAGFAILPDGIDVPRLSPITVTFAKAPAEREAANLFQLSPQPSGTYTWLSTRTALFQPDFPGLSRGSTYTISVPARPEAGLPEIATRKFTVTGQLLVQQVIPSDGDTEVPLGAQVFVQFSRSVAPLTTLGAQRSEPILTFEPALGGKGEWLNTSIYRFVPEDLLPSTAYRMTIAKGLTSAADGVLQDDFSSKFTTIVPGVDAITPDDNSEFASPRQEVVIRFNQPMERSAASGISVRGPSGAVPGTIGWTEGDSVATFTPSARLGVKTIYTVSVAKGLKGARGSETAAARTSHFTTVAAPFVQSTQPRENETGAGRFGVSIQFGTPMDPASLEGKLSISGFTEKDLEGRTFAYENAVGLNVGLKPSTSYTVTLAPGATDRYGQVLGGHRFSFTTGALEPFVALALPGFSQTVTFSSTAEPTLYFQAANMPTVDFTLWPVTGDEGRRLMHDNTGYARSFNPSLAPLRKWTETVKGPKDEVLLGSTSLSGGGPLRKGYYFLRTSGQFASQVAFAVVDTVIVTKLSNDELMAWAVDHDTGNPITGATVRVTGPEITPEDARTDANGLASFRVPALVAGKQIDRSYLVWLDGAGHNGVLSTRWQQGVSAFQFGLQAEYLTREFVGQVYTDRPIYRPGETVEYKGIVRADDDARYSLPPADVAFQFVISNARGQQLQSGTVKPNDFGSFASSFTLPADAPTGDYQLFLFTTRGQAQIGIAGNSFLVAEFRAPEFQVEVSAAKPSYVDGETIDARTTASFFFGGALAGASVEWSALADPFVLRAKGYELYSFTDFDYARQAVSRQAVRAKGKATTGDSGVASFAVPATLTASEGAQRFTLSATVTDQNGQAVAGSAQVTVHPADFYAGIRPAQYVASEGTDARIDLVSVDTEGNVVGNRAVAVKVYERQWITTKEQTPGGGRIYRSEPRDTLITTLRATTNSKGEASVFYKPAKPGTLRLVAEATDARGRVALSAAYLWVWGGGFASWQVTNDDTIKLVADKDSYGVGDTAEILVPAPFQFATGLITVERGKLITRSVQKFPTNSERLRIPINDRSVPNVFVSVVLYRPPTAADPIPRYKVGYVQLPVSTQTRVLNVAIMPDRDQAKPGDTVRYAIRVTDKAGKGVRSEVSVAVVDKAVLSLQEERGPDGLRAFWFERGLGVNTASSMAVSVDRWNDVIAEAPRQGKGGAGFVATDRTRQDFRNTAYWTAQLVTKDDGTATVDVKMPDNLTTWRMAARAISGETMVGEGTNELVSTKPLLLRPALPRFLRVGDDAELRVLLRNATKADVDASVAIKAEGVSVRGALIRSVRVRPQESAIVSWPAKVDAEGTAKIGFNATGPGGLADSVELLLPVVLDVTPETTATGGIVRSEGALEAIYLPPFADQKHGSLSVSVQSALAGSMSSELRFLDPLPHEGAERVASRLIASLGVRRAEKTAGTSTVSDPRIASDIAGIVGHQRGDGGWAWCDHPSCQTDPNVTGWALLALGEARDDGLEVDAGVIERATRYVIGYVNRVTDVAAPADQSQKAFLIAALAAAGRQDAASTPARALFEQSRSRLANWGKGYLLLGFFDSAITRTDPQVRALLDDLATSTIPSASGNHWEDEPKARGSFMSATATTALATLALARVQPDHALLPQTVRWLVVARGADGWRTSIDRALGILALTTYAVTTGELAGDYSYKVQIGDRDILDGLMKPGTTPSTATKSVPLTTLAPGKMNMLAISRDYSRPGRLYYTLDLKYVTPAKEIEALNRGFAISHQYTLLDDPNKPVTSAKVADTVRVKLTIVAPADRSYVVIEDLLPAGLEPVDARLKIVDPALVTKLDAERAQATQRQAGGYVAPWFRWYYSPWRQVDLRDDRAVLFADRLPKGIYEYIYFARATTPGNFFVGPAHAEETYFPEVFGRSDSSRFVVAP